MRHAAARALGLGAFVTLGCAREVGARDVTPWLRVEAWRPSDALMAVSGQNHERVRVRVRSGGSWRTVTDDASGTCAFPIARGERVIVGDDLVRRDGAVVRLACRGTLLPSGDGEGATCFELGLDARAPLTLVTFDRDGRRVAERAVVVPPEVRPFPHALGRRGDDWLFLTQQGSACGVVALGPRGVFREVAPPGRCDVAVSARLETSAPPPLDAHGEPCAP
ncbi:MAG TPA: hypothetical protein VHB21_04680 [Minicystis sp.]|nr:hypothetical protein [Minicystis sp.]